MAAKKLTVVISQSQSANPIKRQLEEDLATRLLMEPGIDISIVPNLTDMAPDHTGLLFLRSVGGPLVVLAWLFPRASRWILDRQGVKGQEGVSLLTGDDEEDEPDAEQDSEETQGIGSSEAPKRPIYTINLQAADKPDQFLEEIRRIASENSQQTVDLMSWIGGDATPEQMERYVNPLPIVDAVPSGNGNGNGNGQHHPEGEQQQSGMLPVIDDPVKRRWYPVIDYSRCTNCMECIDFCLFGVYGVDTLDRILVEAQDNCKKGCPACSRVCPENAIIFPQHKTPGIAGANGEVAGLKIDLSRLFGGDGKDAMELAVSERDEELLKDGRDAVGATVGMPKRQAHVVDKQRDELDDLMDGLDALDL